MWFWMSIAALLCWSGSDVFSKVGCQDGSDKHSHLKMASAVGCVMGVHAAWEIFVIHTEINLDIIITYLPVSCLYILSMLIGYAGLRYIELSISSPICNSSGAIVAVLCMATGGIRGTAPMQLIATALVCVGVVGLGLVEAREDESLREARQKESNRRYVKSWLALFIPIVYCLLDALGTFADSLVLEKLNEDSANTAYELTFFLVGAACFIYTYLIKKERIVLKKAAPRFAGALFETAGQAAYIYALADSEHVAMAAPMISAYCVMSVLWSRLFLKEKLSKKHYAAIAVTVLGIIILGVFDA